MTIEELRKLAIDCEEKFGKELWLEEFVEKIVEKTKPHSNFDKWKDELTVERFAEMASQFCVYCPFWNGKFCSTDKGCEEALTEWANRRCEE